MIEGVPALAGEGLDLLQGLSTEGLSTEGNTNTNTADFDLDLDLLGGLEGIADDDDDLGLEMKMKIEGTATSASTAAEPAAAAAVSSYSGVKRKREDNDNNAGVDIISATKRACVNGNPSSCFDLFGLMSQLFVSLFIT